MMRPSWESMDQWMKRPRALVAEGFEAVGFVVELGGGLGALGEGWGG